MLWILLCGLIQNGFHKGSSSLIEWTSSVKRHWHRVAQFFKDLCTQKYLKLFSAKGNYLYISENESTTCYCSGTSLDMECLLHYNSQFVRAKMYFIHIVDLGGEIQSMKETHFLKSQIWEWSPQARDGLDPLISSKYSTGHCVHIAPVGCCSLADTGLRVGGKPTRRASFRPVLSNYA